MSASSMRKVTISFSGDVVLPSEDFPALSNAASPASVQLVALSSGNNAIPVPTGGSTPTACTIIKPPANTQLITLKGVNGDTGVALHHTDPDSISLDPTCTGFVLNAAGAVNVRLVWS